MVKKANKETKSSEEPFSYRLDEFDDDLSSGSEEQEEPVQFKNVKLKSLWIEKYRPRTIDDLIVDDGTKNKIIKIMKEKVMPNIIITGVPGIGKTTTALCIAKQLLGPYYSQGILETNASDDRGIKSVSELVINFCKQKLEVKKEHQGVYANHKIVLLDEVDNMTQKAQQLISNLMEKYPYSIRFALTCNNSSDIIRAIQSRCIILRYKRIEPDKIVNRLKFICEREHVEYTEDGLENLVKVSQGDLRQAVNNLQSTSNGYEVINYDNVQKICDKPHPMIIDSILLACNEKDFHKALMYLDELRSKGYSGSDISMSMVDARTKLNEDIRMKFMEEISKTSYMISRNKGVNSPIQLTGCIAAICKN